MLVASIEEICNMAISDSKLIKKPKERPRFNFTVTLLNDRCKQRFHN